MATRRESVVLELDDRFTPGMVRAAAAAALFQRELDKLDGSGRRSASGTNEAERAVGSFERTSRTAAPTIDKLSGRLAIFGHTFAAIGPAAVPIAAVAIPAVTGLASGLGFAAVGAGTAALAFHGLGDALTKFNKAAAEPTATNIAAAQAAMDKIPPSAQAFVLELHRLNPELSQLRQAAGAGLFAGLTDGLKSASTDLPIARRLLGDVSTELGTLGREAGKSLGSDQWRPFLHFVDQQAPKALDDLGHAAGSTAHGLAELWMAFAPVDSRFTGGVERLAHDFDQWASSLGKSRDFQSFLEYVDQNGPKVVALLGNVGSLIVDIVKAAAPLGGPTLDALNLIVKALDLIASSPVATPMLALLQVNSILKLTSAGLQAMGVNASVGLGGITKNASASKAALVGVRTEAQSAGMALRTIWGNVGKNASSGTPLMTGVTEEGRANLAKGIALAGGLALASSGAASSLGLQNTAMLATAGVMAGPLGLAIGSGVGLLMDYRSAASQAAQVTDNLSRSMAASAGDIRGQAAAIAAATAAYNGSFLNHRQSLGSALGNTLKHPLQVLNYDVTGGASSSSQQAAIAAANTQLDQQKTALGQIGSGLGSSFKDLLGRDILPSATQLQQIADRVTPAMAQLGITWQGLNKLQTQSADFWNPGHSPYDHAVAQIVSLTKSMDSAKGRTDSVAQAFAGMSNQAQTSDQRVQALSSSLDALLGPGLNVSQASDAFQKGLNDLASGLDKHTKSLRGNSDAVIANRQAIRDQVTNISALVKAQAAAGASPQKLTRSLQQQRQALIDAGTAAGVSKSDMKGYLDQLGLTPKLVKTVIQQVGIQNAINNVTVLRNGLEGLNGRVFSATLRLTRQGAGTRATGGISLLGQADGGTIPGDRHPYGDKILMLGAPGEEVISNRFGQADRYRRDRAAGAIPAYGFGGTVGTVYSPNHAGSSPSSGSTSSSTSSTSSTNAAAISPAVRGLNNDLHRFSTTLSAATSALNAEIQARQALVQTVRDAFRTDIFASQGGSWSANGGVNPLAALRSNIAGANRFDSLLHGLVGRGLSGGAFEALANTGSVQDAQVIANYSGRQLRAYERLYSEQQRRSRAVGQYAGDARYGTQIAALKHEVALDRAHQHRVEHQLAEIKKAAAQTGPAATVKGLNSAASNGARRKRKGGL